MSLIPEIEEGNIEYKRYLINVDSTRLEQLATQMKWRLSEGDNQAIYYLGVDDDGTPYPINEKEKKETLNNFILLLEKNNAEIIDFKVIKTTYSEKPCSYFKITIRRKTKILPEVRIVLLGDSQTGKTTFLSNILLNKIDGKTEARIYLMNHKHELETKKTSSINCHYKIFKNSEKEYKYTFLEAPGSEQYKRTKYKTLLGTHPNLCLLFTDKFNNYNHFDKFILDKLDIPYIIVNIFDSNSLFYCKKLIDKEQIFLMINSKINSLNSNDAIHETKFNILNIYPHNDLGIIVSGFLVSGKIEINKPIFWKIQSNYVKCQIKSIHINSEPVKKFNKQQMLTVCLQTNKIPKKNWKYGLLVNNKEKSSNTNIKQTFSINNFNNINEITNLMSTGFFYGYCENKLIYFTDIRLLEDNKFEANVSNYYYEKSPIIIDCNFKGIVYGI
jgi:GTPase